ncbi:stimulated by retinoic acid gene 6 protein-like isoform X2 [Liolophura sinensis]|uniref:stimulated by retinoic acid gene 6 protein-like isoform X2 n=1 Tax=Liolophura sinensis TaxID=3198878 RepID=UPI003158FF10
MYDLNMYDMNKTTVNVTVECRVLLQPSTFMHFALIPSIAIIAAFAILHRKNTKCGRLSWRPGMVVPVDFLDGYTNRWAHAAAFGAMSNRLLALLVNRDQYWGEDVVAPYWVKRTLLLLLAMLETSLVFYPIFACLNSPYKLVGGILGACYSLTWCIVQLIYMFDCPHTDFPTFLSKLNLSYSKLILQWPSAAFFLVIVGHSVYMLWICWETRVFVVKGKRRLALPHHLVYARCLLNGKLPKRIVNVFDEGFVDTFKYKSIHGFSYPSRILCVLFVGISLSYQIVINIFDGAGKLSTAVAELARPVVPEESVSSRRFWLDALTIQTVCTWIASVLVLLIMIGTSFLILKNYRRNILQLFRGDRSFLPPINLSPTTLMATGMRWPGYQIAYLFWGWNSVGTLVEWIVSPILMSLIIFYSQKAWARFFFLQPRPGPDQPVPLALDNRNAFDSAYYITFFLNITIGLFACMKRLLLSLVVGLLTLGRTDQPFVKRGYERLDKGYRAYLGQLFLDYTHNHPVLRIFCDELLTLTDDLKFQSPFDQYRMASSNKGDANRRARRRWHVAYTLVRNPDLIAGRKHNISFHADQSAGDNEAIMQPIVSETVGL